jgi:hypothetical protein
MIVFFENFAQKIARRILRRHILLHIVSMVRTTRRIFYFWVTPTECIGMGRWARRETQRGGRKTRPPRLVEKCPRKIRDG